MVMVISGAVGIFGLVRVIWLAEQLSPHADWAKTTLAAIGVGLGGLMFFNLYDPSPGFYESLLLLVLPCIGVGHVVFLARHSLRLALRPRQRSA
jgi:hypothetical protein